MSGVSACCPSRRLGPFKVWTRRFGSNPRIKLLLLHGGPGGTHEYFEPCDATARRRREYYYYDQLGSHYSDQPDIPELWSIPRFVERGGTGPTSAGT